jgi:iron complex transport system ATP-binding protein
MAIILDALQIGYKEKGHYKTIAAPIYLEAPTASLTSIVGLNGAGKTTLIKSIGRYVPLIKGSIFIQGQSLKNLSNQELSRLLSVVLTSPLASENMTVYELVSLGRYPYLNWFGRLGKSDLQSIQEAIEFSALEDLVEKKIYQLSDGQKQKAHIARALAQDTPYMILDEPMAHLDLHHKAQLLSLIQKLIKKKKKTVLITSHDIETALNYSDQILVIGAEKTISGSPEMLLKKRIFEDLFPKEFIGFNPQTRQFSYKGVETK